MAMAIASAAVIGGTLNSAMRTAARSLRFMAEKWTSKPRTKPDGGGSMGQKDSFTIKMDALSRSKALKRASRKSVKIPKPKVVPSGKVYARRKAKKVTE